MLTIVVSGLLSALISISSEGLCLSDYLGCNLQIFNVFPIPPPFLRKGASRPLSPTAQGEKQNPLNRWRSLSLLAPGARARFASVLTRSVLSSTLDPLRCGFRADP